MHIKQFLKWNSAKTHIDQTNDRPFYHEREVWWCTLGVNVGFEQDGKGKTFSRPILIIKSFSKEVLWCVPLTTKNKKGKYYFDIALGDGYSRKAILSQLRIIDSKRLQEKICTIDQQQFTEIKKAVTSLIG